MQCKAKGLNPKATSLELLRGLLKRKLIRTCSRAWPCPFCTALGLLSTAELTNPRHSELFLLEDYTELGSTGLSGTPSRTQCGHTTWISIMMCHHRSVGRSLPQTTISSKRARKSWFQGWPYPFCTASGLLSTAEPSILGIPSSSCSRIA
jgi:hypothetical protein